MGAHKLTVLLHERLHDATSLGDAKQADFTRVIIDTTVRLKAIIFPTNAKLLHRARERLVGWRRSTVRLRQS